ncbi:hypothetical protein CXK93_12175 [Stutzerimonas decontaminans]|uniref:Uncharacterized protein n=1 Tax=Stutzerimonas decontaminans TaxID=3022791 RepID=A0ABX4VY72_9GAMM|nr:hypothetical protein [Stutzerimonas decontaminans]MCQ4245588.1 hypothetical protein [Stutzerimonas decontaminans]PNF85021.1 hypothetical protein CXK93_12175 [Stutzerimonas decontaminans]
MTYTIFYSTEMPNDTAQVSGRLPRKPQRWSMEWLVKTPDGKTHIDNSRTIQHATYEEVNAIMGAIIDDIKAEIGELATFISYRLTCHGSTKKHRKGGKRR